MPVRGDIGANLARHLEMIRLAAAQRADLLLFPELSLTGYELDLVADLAFETGDPRLEVLRVRAIEHGLTIVVGAPVRLDTGLHIGAFTYEPRGVVGLYTKHHLGGDEAKYVVPGERNPRLDLRGRTAAIAICADANQASHAGSAAERGADFYLTSAFVEVGDQVKKEATLAGHASHHAMTVVLANYGGASGGLPSGGRSAVWDRSGKMVVQAPSSGAALVIARPNQDRWTGRTLDLRGEPL